MRKTPSFLSVAFMEIFSLPSMLWIFSIGLIYILLTLYLLNYRFVLATLTNSFPLPTKLVVISSLLGGLFSAFSPLDSTIVIVSALLIGLNILIMIKTISVLGKNGKVHVSIGGATILGLMSTGCTSCGFSLLSVLGLSSSVSFLPFHGLELHVLSVGFLLFSALYMLKKLQDSKYCRV